MRKALNENPKVQAGMIVLLLLVGVFMFMKMSGGGESANSDDAIAELNAASAQANGVAAAGGAAPATAAGSGAGATVSAPASTAVPTAPTAATGTIPPEALIPGPGLPADVAQAYARGQVIVLLLVKEGAIDDELVKDAVGRISRSGVSVFVAPASKVARYSRITQGVGVSRVPALVVVRPRSGAGASPLATVSYGFRELSSVLQAIDDALYQGRDDLPYHPG